MIKEQLVSFRTFRDPDGELEDRGVGPLVRRLVGGDPAWLERLEALEAIKHLQRTGGWVESLPDPADPHLRLHPRVFFPAHPAEWTAGMLIEAGHLTLDVNLALLEEGWELKDATPRNVLFQGVRPIFVDHFSPVPREGCPMGWRAYGQFSRCFLIPLLLSRRLGIPLSWIFTLHRDGLDPADALPLFRGLSKFSPGVFSTVTLPAWLGRRSGQDGRAMGLPQAASEEVARETTRAILQGLKRKLGSPAAQVTSTWVDYQDAGTSYTPEGLVEKNAFVARCLQALRPATVLDLACNTGRHAREAAKNGATVVALDKDMACLDRVFSMAHAEGLNILPLRADLGWPSPALGWDGEEEKSLRDRLEGRFECVLALGLIHHLLIRERLPLVSLVDFLARVTSRHLLLEWIPPTDPQFQSLAGPNRDLYVNHAWEHAKPVFGKRFSLQSEHVIPGTGRSLHLLEKLR